jgi:hypothetical protein
MQLPLARHDEPHDTDSSHNAIYATLAQLKGRKVYILHSKPPDTSGPPEHLRDWKILGRYIDTLAATMRNELHMQVTKTSEWEGHDDCDVIVCPEISFASLKIIREKSKGQPPAALFIAMGT